MRTFTKKAKLSWSFAIFLLILVAILTGILWLSMRKPQTPAPPLLSESPGNATLSGKWNEGVIEYQGHFYKYNASMETYLFLGIDKEGPVETLASGIDGGQSDAIFLMALNNKTQEISVIGINRNTMTAVDRYSPDGKYLETQVMQLCLQHGYGDGAGISCSRTAKAVSNLFDGLPITGYISLNMGGIRILNNGMGGVSLKVLENISSGSISLKKDEYVTLSGDEAYCYVRYRDLDTFDSASMRMERQMQYVAALASQARVNMNGNVSKAIEILESAEEYICTNVTYNRLADCMMHYRFDEANMYSLAGRTKKGTKWEEFYINEAALNELIFKVFYDKVA